jgi:hypothetical protein
MKSALLTTVETARQYLLLQEDRVHACYRHAHSTSFPSHALEARYEKTKQTKTGHPSKLVLKQQTEGAAIKTERAVPGGGGYIEE